MGLQKGSVSKVVSTCFCKLFFNHPKSGSNLYTSWLTMSPPGREARKARAAASAAAAVPPAVSAVSVVCALSPRKCVFARFLGAMSQEPHTTQLHASLEHVECCNFSFAFSGIVFDSCREEKTHPLKKVIVLWFLFHFFLWNQTIHVQVFKTEQCYLFLFLYN